MSNAEKENEEVLPGAYFDDRCPKRRESARKSADTRAHDEVSTRRNLTFGQRLSLGFEMLDEDDPKDDDE